MCDGTNREGPIAAAAALATSAQPRSGCSRERLGPRSATGSALCLKLKLHAEEELSDDDVRDTAGLDRLRAVVEETADAIGDAYDDEAVRADARDMARAFVDAIDSTMRDAQDRLRSSG